MEKSAVSEHAELVEHDVNFNRALLLNKEQSYGKRMMKKLLKQKSVRLTSTVQQRRRACVHVYQ